MMEAVKPVLNLKKIDAVLFDLDGVFNRNFKKYILPAGRGCLTNFLKVIMKKR